MQCQKQQYNVTPRYDKQLWIIFSITIFSEINIGGVHLTLSTLICIGNIHNTVIQRIPVSYYILNIKCHHNRYQASQSYLPAARSSIQKFDNDCEVIFMFKM